MTDYLQDVSDLALSLIENSKHKLSHDAAYVVATQLVVLQAEGARAEHMMNLLLNEVASARDYD